MRHAILAALLNEAAFDGWTETALANAAKAAGYAPEMGRIAFSGGIADAAKLFIRQQDDALETALAGVDLSAMRVRDKISTLVMTRIGLYAPHKEAVSHLVSYFSLPHHAPVALQHAFTTADKLWILAGDTATDYNWYTKRVLLAGVYSSTLLYWLQDESEDHHATREFLARRIENIMQIEKAKGTVRNMVESLTGKLTPKE